MGRNMNQLKLLVQNYHIIGSRRLVLSALFAAIFGISVLLPMVSGASSGSVLERIGKAEKFTKNSLDPQPAAHDTVLSREQYQGGSFRVLARKDKIERFRCSSCHNEKPVTVRRGAELTHGDVSLRHGQFDSLTCIDCHDAENRDYLEDKKGNEIDFDHSYQLCGQCHFRQKSDWLGGAHGKRVEFWAGERVIYNCTTCHNPHSPKFEKRFPVTYSPQSD